MSDAGDKPATRRGEDVPRSTVGALLVAVTVILGAFPIAIAQPGRGPGGYDFQTIVFPSDIPLVLLIVLMVPVVVGRIRERRFPAVAWALLALLAWMVVAFAVHPSQRGVADLVRLAGLLAMVVAIVDLKQTSEWALVLISVGAVAVFETGVGVAELVHGGYIGLGAFGEFGQPLWRFGGGLAPQATMVHPYVFAGFGLVAGFLFAAAYTRRPVRALLAGAAIAIVPLGYTYSRAGLLGFVGALAVLASAVFVPALRSRFIPVVLALAVGAAVPALIWRDGWVSRANQSVKARNAASLSTDRGWLIHEATGLIVDHPVFGVGPGLYVTALKEKYGTERNRSVGIFKPVHNLPLLLTAEGGIPAGLAMTALLILAGLRSLRGGRPALALFIAYLAFTQLDHFAYDFPQGLIITALWLGGIEVLASMARSDDFSELPLEVVDLVA